MSTLLSRPDVTLFEVIEDEDFLGELAENNEQLSELYVTCPTLI